MGLDDPTLKFLAAAKANGVEYANTLTIGRQSLHMADDQLFQIFQELGIRQDVTLFQRELQGYGEPFFRLLGAQGVSSIDASSYEGATFIHDLNEPIDGSLKNQFSVVFDGGTLEHIFNFPQAIRNCMEMVRVGGHFLQVSNANNFMGHGFYQFSPELIFGVFSEGNGFATEAVFLHEYAEGDKWYRVVDPKAIGKRVELCNRNPTLMLTIARRISMVPIFARFPQQSDYVAIWRDPSIKKRPILNGGKHVPFRRVRRLIPEPVKRVVRRAMTRPPAAFSPEYYRQVSDREFLRGNFG